MSSKPNHGQILVDSSGRALPPFQGYLDELEGFKPSTGSKVPAGAPGASQTVVNIYHDGTSIKYVLNDGTVI